MGFKEILGFTVIGALVTTAGTLLGLFLKEVLFARSFERWKAKQSLDRLSRRYRDPITLSALELCNRLTRICDTYPPDFLAAGLLAILPARPSLNSSADPYFKRYTLISSVYRLCSFLGWIELFRQEITFLQINEGTANVRLDQAIYAIRSDLADGELNSAKDWDVWYDALLFREEQRAIGESMITISGDIKVVMGYAEFCDLFPGDKNTSRGRWIEVASSLFLDPKANKDFRLVRMRRLVAHLVDLVEVLAPSRLRDDHRDARSRFHDATVNTVA
jgi:hypothetical protein